MKADLYVMGVYNGEIEVEENGIAGVLMTGRFGEAMGKAKAMWEKCNAAITGAALARLMGNTEGYADEGHL